MKFKTLATVALGTAALVFGTAHDGRIGFVQAQAQAETVRPEIGKPLKEASALIKAGKFKDALAKLQEAESVGGRTPVENYNIEGMRVAAASGAGDADSMVKGFEAMKASGRLSQAEQLRMIESIAGTFLRNKDNARALTWSQRYFKEGGTSATMKQVQTSAQFYSGDMAGIIKQTLEEISADEKAGRTPPQDKLNLLLTAASRQKDSANEALATEKLLNYYPRKELWAQTLGSLPQKKGFSDRFALDVYRLKLATGNMRSATDYMEMAQLAAQAGYPEEGKQVVDKGMAANVLGQGAEGARHKRLMDLMVKRTAEVKAALPAAESAAQDAKDGNALVSIGLGYALRGDASRGVKLIEQGIAKGSLKRPEDAKLYLGMAHALAGETAKAQASWRNVKGNDGVTDLAHLWSIQVRGGKR